MLVTFKEVLKLINDQFVFYGQWIRVLSLFTDSLLLLFQQTEAAAKRALALDGSDMLVLLVISYFQAILYSSCHAHQAFILSQGWTLS